MKSRRMWIVTGSLVVLLIGVAVALKFSLHSAQTVSQFKTPQEAQNVYVRFDMEAYDDIEADYWQSVNDADLANLFQLSLEKAAASSSIPLPSSNRAGTASMLYGVFSATSTQAARALAVNTLIVALYNLAPQGHDQLLSQAQEVQLSNEVNNINPSVNLYSNLGVTASATPSQIQSAYQQKLAQATSSAQEQAVTYAAQVLSNSTDRARYNATQAQPTVFSQVLGHTLYLYLSDISPSTAQEFAQAVDQASTTPDLNSMIIDLRGNIGGDLSFVQYFLGLFQGENQYAFDIFHQGQYEVERTLWPQFSELNRYREIAVLTDGMTQSTAELTAASLLHLHLAFTVGSTTRGWGSVEQAYPIKTVIDPTTSYSLLLVTGLTLRPDNEPIEGNGVPATIAVSDPNWRSELSNYFYSPSLITAVEETVTRPPHE